MLRKNIKRLKKKIRKQLKLPICRFLRHQSGNEVSLLYSSRAHAVRNLAQTRVIIIYYAMAGDIYSKYRKKLELHIKPTSIYR